MFSVLSTNFDAHLITSATIFLNLERIIITHLNFIFLFILRILHPIFPSCTGLIMLVTELHMALKATVQAKKPAYVLRNYYK